MLNTACQYLYTCKFKMFLFYRAVLSRLLFYMSIYTVFSGRFMKLAYFGFLKIQVIPCDTTSFPEEIDAGYQTVWIEIRPNV